MNKALKNTLTLNHPRELYDDLEKLRLKYILRENSIVPVFLILFRFQLFAFFVEHHGLFAKFYHSTLFENFTPPQ